MKPAITLLIIILLKISAFAQELPLVTVTDLTIKVDILSEEHLYYAFEKDDVIYIEFKEQDGDELKEFELTEYPSRPVFSQYKVSGFKKEIRIPKRGIYHFRLYNSKLFKNRVCLLKVKRKPSSKKTQNFNTSIGWKTVHDTSYNIYEKEVITGYDTVYVDKTKLELVKVDTNIVTVLERTERVHSQTALGKSNKTYVKVLLPKGEISLFKITRTISWAYWLGVGEEAQTAYNQAREKLVNNTVSGLATYMGLGPLAPFAVAGVDYFTTPTVGHNVEYWFIDDHSNVMLFMNDQAFYQFDQGNGIMSKGRHTSPLQGEFYIGLQNDNIRNGIDVNLKVIAIQVTKYFENNTYQVPEAIPKKEIKIFKDPIITSKEIPYILN